MAAMAWARRAQGALAASSLHNLCAGRLLALTTPTAAPPAVDQLACKPRAAGTSTSAPPPPPPPPAPPALAAWTSRAAQHRRPGSAAASPAQPTIFALSSAPGRSAVAVVRISGPEADSALHRLLPPARPLPPPRTAALASLLGPDGGLLDRALVLRFPGPHSFTGEDCVELHLHGGPAVVRAVLDALQAAGLRPAEAGQFSRRAFDAGKLDLTQVEGLADLLAAETESQRRQALRHSTGAVRRQHEQWRQTLLTCLARLEAVIDFGEDEEIADDVAAGVAPLVEGLRRELDRHLAAATSGELIRSGVRVAIVGPPNAGKSSLLNLVAGHEAAIVSPLAGTTRDVVQVQLELGGVKVVLIDSAGLRHTECPIEAEGVRRAVAAAQQAHVVLHLADARAAGAGAAPDEAPGSTLQLLPGAAQLWVLNKADLLGGGAAKAAAAGSAAQPLLISCKTGAGIEQLLAALQGAVQALLSSAAGDDGVAGALVTRARHRHHLGEAAACLGRYPRVAAELELGCEELRGAARALGRVTGAIDTEQVLDQLFAEFCIGK